MKKTDLVAKIVQLEKQLLVYSTNGFVSVQDAKKLAEQKSGEENHKLTTKIEQLEQRNELLMSRISTIDQMLRERNRKSPQSRPEEGSNKSSSSSLSTVINVSSQASSSDHSSKCLSLNRSIPEMMESYSVVRLRNIVEPDSNPFHEYSEIDVKDVEEEKKKSKASPNKIGIFKKSFNLISEALSRQHSQKESKKESEKPQNTNPFFESEDDEIDDREKRDEDIPVPDFNSNVLQTLLKESCNEMKDTRTLVKQLSSELLNNPFWSEDECQEYQETESNKSGNILPPEKPPRDIKLLEGLTVKVKPSFKSSIKTPEIEKNDNDNEIISQQKTFGSVLKKPLGKSISLDNSRDEDENNKNNRESLDFEISSIKSEPVTFEKLKGDNIDPKTLDFDTSSIKSEPVTSFKRMPLCQTVSLDGGEILF